MAFSTHFCHIKNDLYALFDRKLQVIKISPKFTIFGVFNELLSTQNVNEARFARNVECDFLCDFQTPCATAFYKLQAHFLFSKSSNLILQ